MSTNDTTPTRPDINALTGFALSGEQVLCLNGTYLRELAAWVEYLERTLMDQPCRDCGQRSSVCLATRKCCETCWHIRVVPA